MLKFDDTFEEIPKEKTRRNFIKGIFIGALAGSILGKSKQAFADPVGGDTTILTEISTWMKVTWATEVLPVINTLKEWYKEVKEWIGEWNKFVDKFNTLMNLSKDVRDFFTQKQDNWFYQSYVQLKEYLNEMMKVDGDVLSYRLHYYDPIFVAKIDSMMFQFENLVSRAQKIANSYLKLGAKPKSNDDAIRETKEGKLAIRSTNDHAKYLESQARLLSIKQTYEKVKEKIPGIMKMNDSPDNLPKIMNDLITPKILESNLLMCSIMSEVYCKLNDIFLIMSKEDPVVSSTENIVTRDDMKKILKDLSTGNPKGFIV